MKRFLKIMLLAVAVSMPISVWAGTINQNPIEKNYFQFVIKDYQTKRQSGQTVDIYVRYAYKQNLPTADYPDYRKLRENVLQYMEPTDELPAEVFWEILATKMGRDLIQTYPLDGISIQLNVHDNTDPTRYEPGDHGPTFTIGKIAPLDVH